MLNSLPLDFLSSHMTRVHLYFRNLPFPPRHFKCKDGVQLDRGRNSRNFIHHPVLPVAFSSPWQPSTMPPKFDPNEIKVRPIFGTIIFTRVSSMAHSSDRSCAWGPSVVRSLPPLPLLPRSVLWVCRQRRSATTLPRPLRTGRVSRSPCSSPSRTGRQWRRATTSLPDGSKCSVIYKAQIYSFNLHS